MRHHIGLIHKDAASDHGVSFPDLPGCATAGRTLDEARAEAEAALAFHAEGPAQDREPLPEPSTLEAVVADAADRDGVAVLVALKAPATRAVRVNVTLPDDLLDTVDRHAEANGFTRSGFLALAARRAVGAV